MVSQSMLDMQKKMKSKRENITNLTKIVRKKKSNHKQIKHKIDNIIISDIENTKIVDNNSKDNSVKNIKEKFPDIKVIHSEVNRGYAGGCNLGAQNAKGKYLLFLNDDTVIYENAIDILFNMIEKDKNISAVQPKILNYYDKDQFDYAGASGGYIDYLGYPFSRGRIFNTIEKETVHRVGCSAIAILEQSSSSQVVRSFKKLYKAIYGYVMYIGTFQELPVCMAMSCRALERAV